MSANERRMQILEVLCERRHETRENLANEFGVSKRTIEYDIQTLMLSYPIYTTQGGGGGIHVMDGYRFGKKYMTDKQRYSSGVIPTLVPKFCSSMNRSSRYTRETPSNTLRSMRNSVLQRATTTSARTP